MLEVETAQFRSRKKFQHHSYFTRHHESHSRVLNVCKREEVIMKAKNQFLEEAVLAFYKVAGKPEVKPKNPKDDLSWIKANQAYRMSLESFQKAEFAVYAAQEAKHHALKLLRENRVNLELKADELGIEIEGDDT